MWTIRSGWTVSALEGLIELGARPRDLEILPEALPHLGDLLERALEPLSSAGHAAAVPHHVAQLAVEAVGARLAVDG